MSSKDCFSFSNVLGVFIAAIILSQSIVVSEASAGSFMVTLDLTASGGSVQTSGEIAYNADATDTTGGRTGVKEILQVNNVSYSFP